MWQAAAALSHSFLRHLARTPMRLLGLEADNQGLDSL